MLVRGFTVGPKPWKVFLCHQVHNLKQSYKRRWHATIGWLMTRKISWYCRAPHCGMEFGLLGVRSEKG